MWFLVAAGVALVLIALGARKGMAMEGRTLESLRELGNRAAALYRVDPELLWAVVKTENAALDPRAYNPEGYSPPEGKPAYLGTIPEGADISGYQGSFGMAQIFHSAGWSTARAFGAGGSYPQDLMDPYTNLKISAAFLSYLQKRGFVFPSQIDVYNLGETAFNQGKRNPYYVSRVKANLGV